jgi:hypothetical protein
MLKSDGLDRLAAYKAEDALQGLAQKIFYMKSFSGGQLLSWSFETRNRTPMERV